MKLILASNFSGNAKKICALLKREPCLGNKVLFVDTAARGEGWIPDPVENIKPLEDIGFVFTTYDIAGKSEADVRAAMADAAVVYVCGGNTFYLLEYMQKCNFAALIRERLKQGAVYIGASAGSIVCSPDIAFAEKMDPPPKGVLSDTAGLGFIPFLFLPHLDHPDLGAAAQTIVSSYQGTWPLIALYDCQFLYVRDRVIEVF